MKAHSAQGVRGVNRKHHPAERCDFEIWLSKRTENFQSARKNFLCALSQISNHTSPQGDVCTKAHRNTVCFEFFCALWVKAHSMRSGRGVYRKHHPAERCDLRFGSKRTEKLKSHEAQPQITPLRRVMFALFLLKDFLKICKIAISNNMGLLCLWQFF